jgi:hypothetical protein
LNLPRGKGDRDTRLELANVLSDLGNFSASLEELKFIKTLGGVSGIDELIGITESRLQRRAEKPADPALLKVKRSWSNAWVMKGGGFEVRTNTTPEFCAEFLEVLKNIAPYYNDEFDLRGEIEKRTAKVFMFKNRDEYREFCKQTAPELINAAGFFDPKRRLIASYRRRGILNDDNVEVLQHEATHMATYIAFHRNLPGWLAEGLAEYYEGVKVRKDGKVTPTGTKPRHIETIRKHIADKKALSVRAIISAEMKRFFDKRDSIYYAQSWVLVSLLKTKHAAELDRMLLDIRRGQEPEKVINKTVKEIFGSDAALENAWKLHFEKLAKMAASEKK